MKIAGYIITLRQESVGPRNDPYGRDTIRVEGIHAAEWMSCSLAGDVVRLYHEVDGRWHLVREMKCGFGNSHDPKYRQQQLKMRLLFKHHVGIYADQAEEMLVEAQDKADREIAEEFGEETLADIKYWSNPRNFE